MTRVKKTPEKQENKIRVKKIRPKTRKLFFFKLDKIDQLLFFPKYCLEVNNEESAQDAAQDVNPRVAMLWDCGMVPIQRDPYMRGQNMVPHKPCVSLRSCSLGV